MQCEATIINVNYRLAPENKAPDGIRDAYAAVKWIMEHGKDLGIDGKRVGLIGYNAGAYIAAGCAWQFALKEFTSQLKCQIQVCPLVGNAYCRDEEDEFFEEHELRQKDIQNHYMRCLAPDLEVVTKDMRVFPNLIPDDMVKVMPAAFIMTAEFDICKKHAEDAAELYRKNGRLIGYGCVKGTHSNFFMDYRL